MEIKCRNSSIELLKIIAIVIIILCHAVPCSGVVTNVYYFNPTHATTNISEFILIIFRYLGGIGNILFFICSSYFLLNSKKVKKEKILKIIINSFIISILFLLLYTLYYGDLSFPILIKQFFPITFNNTWFITCYLLLYIIHPLLNIIIDNINKKQHFTIISIMFVLYSCINFMLKNNFYYNELICFIYVYFIVAYIKKYARHIETNKKLNTILVFLSLFCLMMLIMVTNILGLKYTIFSDKLLHWAGICNPFTIMFGLSLFDIFININFYNKLVNFLSQQTLLIYLIHENYLFRTFIKPSFYEYIYSKFDIVIGTVLQAIIILIGSLIISIFYNLIFSRAINKLSILLNKWLCNFTKKIGVSFYEM